MRGVIVCLLGFLMAGAAAGAACSSLSLDEAEVGREDVSTPITPPVSSSAEASSPPARQARSRRTWFGMGYEQRRRAFGLSGRSGGRAAGRGR